MADQVHLASDQLSAIRPELWSAAFYDVLKEALIFTESISSEYQGEIRSLGDILNVSQFEQFSAATNIAEDEANDADSIAASTLQLTINRLTVKDYIVTDVAKVQTIEHANQLRDLSMFAILKKMQSDIISDIAPSAATPDHTLAYTSGTTLALADILAIKEVLDTALVAKEGRVIAMGTAQENDIFNITGFTSRDFIPSGSPLTSGLVPSGLLGFDPRTTTEVGNVVYAFHPRFYQMAVQKELGVEVFNLGVQGKRAQRVNSTLLWGGAQFSDIRVANLS